MGSIQHDAAESLPTRIQPRAAAADWSTSVAAQILISAIDNALRKLKAVLRRLNALLISLLKRIETRGQIWAVRVFKALGVDPDYFLPETVVATVRAGYLDAHSTMESAAASGQAQMLEFLANYGNDVRRVSLNTVIAAAQNGYVDVLRCLQEHGFNLRSASLSENIIGEAARARRAEVIVYLHRTGCLPNVLPTPGRETIASMKREIAQANHIYQPSAFWKELNRAGETLLEWVGESNFKRTLNQGYFNFIPSEDNAQIKRLRRLLGSKAYGIADSCEIEDPDYDPNVWTSWCPNYQAFRGPDRSLSVKCYKEFVAMLYEYGQLRDSSGLLERLDEPTLGNPIAVRRQGRPISQDLVNSVRERNSIVEALEYYGSGDPNPRIAELGAGYGRLGYVLLKSTAARYFVFDIPPALYVSQWYLSSLFPERKIFSFRTFSHFEEIQDELSAADIAFFTPNQLEMFPPAFFDAFASISSLHEMRREQIAHFLSIMGVTTKSIIYLKQHKEYKNPADHLLISRNDYPTPKGFQYDFDRFDLVNPGFFERIFYGK
jgi:putative sugar O-methyltransferase